MEVIELTDPAEFLARAGPLLLADEARHNLIVALAHGLRDRPAAFPKGYWLWLVCDAGDEVVAAALQTPPNNLVLARPSDSAALDALAEAVLAEDVPGVVGAIPEVEQFVQAWSSRGGRPAEVRRRQGIYALDEVIPPGPTPGAARAADEHDVPLLVTWLRAFSVEALGETEPDEELQQAAERRLANPDAGFLLWADGGPVSLVGYGGPTPNGIGIAPVYTPPELRGRGYASSVTAAASAQLLASGRRFCFLYTDLANPTANKIYVQIGYRRVCDSAEYAFRPR
jgi:predicted GNAT family acetyltransferase